MQSIPHLLKPTQNTLNNIGINSDEVRVIENTGVVASIINWLPQNSSLSQLLIDWFGDSGTQAVASFIDQAREGYGRSDLAPANFVTASGDTIKVWDSVSSDGKKRELNYSRNDGPTTTIPGCVALLCVELAQAAHNKAADDPDCSATERELLEKINLDNFDFSGSDLQGTYLSGLSLREASFEHCNIENVKMVECDLEGALFIATTMNKETKFDRCIIAETYFRACDFYGASFCDVSGRPADFIASPSMSGESDADYAARKAYAFYRS